MDNALTLRSRSDALSLTLRYRVQYSQCNAPTVRSQYDRMNTLSAHSVLTMRSHIQFCTSSHSKYACACTTFSRGDNMSIWVQICA